MKLHRKFWAFVAAASALTMLMHSPAYAASWDVPFDGEDLKATLNTTLTAGIGVRMQSPSETLIGKADLNPNVCAPPYQSCQGLFRTQIFPAQHLAAAPGSFSINGDFGDLNYAHKGAIFQAPLKATSDLTLNYRDFGIFARALYFYDARNDNFNDYHPNEVTPQNAGQVGRFGTNLPINLLNPLCPPISALNNLLEPILGALPLPTPNLGAICGRFYGPGGVVRSKRTDHEVLQQAGMGVQPLDAFFFGKVPLWEDRVLSFKIGRQLVNWGESTTLVLNSINSSNPVNANNFYRIGNQTEEDFIPVNMVDLAFNPIENLNVEGYYQLEWKPIESPTPGTYFSSINIGTNNVGSTLDMGSGQLPYDPQCQAKLLDNPLSTVMSSCATMQRLPDWNPRTSGQYGLKLDYYMPDFNNGTDVAFYYENYHSRLPMASFFSAYPGCLRREGNRRQNDAANALDLFLDCPDIPLLHAGNAAQGSSTVAQFETAKFVLEYPENIHLIGASFNTTVGEYSLQGEVAYRPNKPMQVDAHDLGFASLGAQGARCGEPGITCDGSDLGGLGFAANGGTQAYGNSNAVNSSGKAYTTDTFNMILAHVTGAQRYFPNFVIPYRGGTVGENTPCYPKPGSAEEKAFGFSGFSHPYYPYDRNSPCYIRGYERMQDFEFNLGATRVFGATDNPIGADQVTMVYEVGAEYVPFLPSYDRLVLEGPNSTSSPTAGADGSGADGSRMGCSNIPDCSYGPDGLRFNPHQQDHAGYPRAFSWGYRIISLLNYEQVIPGITLRPFLLFSHDVGGISPGPAGNFVKGRKTAETMFEFRYHQALSFGLGYEWLWGGGAYNVLSDRDFAQFYMKYQF